ncbi:SDR family NAD(P)-dependent oxidoreductase [Jannaschia sp. Os4]|uniref:SDR family NAD(P)-dependent oxidoreductase n=1 Tax=Jannaschia sp. Os4 TaxID=2807617 RepID=UPI0019392F22|nr:SDR family NAD(P)-dependent oxidoreductase [Jannaschia sp. Os4]
MSTPRTALVTGGNRGIGYAVCAALLERGLRVWIGARDEAAGREAVERLGGPSERIDWVTLEVTDGLSVEEAAATIDERGSAIDVLVNNAGIYPQAPLLEAGADDLSEALEVNTVGPLRTTTAFLPGMNARGYGRVVNMSSGYGAVCAGLSGPPLYSVSKAALNALTQALAAEAGTGVAVSAMCPGWVRTRMGGNGAERSPEEAADTAVWLATAESTEANGRFFRDRKEIGW